MSEELFDNEVKLNYYQILGIEKKAGDEEIKRAYFKLVRKFQPGTSPEKFKEIRAAYETLRDKEKRAEYDAVGDMPDSMIPLFNNALSFDHIGRHTKAAELYRKILKAHPELDNVREQYAKSLSMDDKTGKAAEIWEELCKRNPSNAYYSYKLATCYYNRSWNKKGENEIQRALALDPTIIDAWCLLIEIILDKGNTAPDREIVFNELKNTVHEALKAIKDVKEKEWEKIHIYSWAFTIDSSEDLQVGRGYLREISHIIREYGKRCRQEAIHGLVVMLKNASRNRLGEFYNELKAIADMLPDIKTKWEKGSFIITEIEKIRIIHEIQNLEKNGFSEALCNILQLLNMYPEKDDEDKINITAMEFTILKEQDSYIPQLRRLRAEYPELYALHSSFFNEALRNKDHERMLYQRSKKVHKYNRESGLIDNHPEDFPDQTIRRSEPKIGRNDPCPCGSGKKYKKCCGAA